jgi:type IV pilus assembly protein PilX
MQPHPLSRPSSLPAAQRGATLIVGLVLLLVLTVVGVSGMNTATMEINMAANTQFQQDAFQQTEDGIDVMIGTRDYTTEAARTLDWTGNASFDRRAVTVYRLNTGVPDVAFSDEEYEAFHFDVTSIGRGPRNAQSQHTQSFYVVGRAL